MKVVTTSLKFTIALLLLVMAVGCASIQQKENLLIAAGFKVITPSKPNQVALLPTLPPDKVTRISYKGKTFYVMPDLAHNQAYVGGPRQYRAYRQLRLQNQLANENLEAASMNMAASMNWGMWGGWGGPGWYGGWY